MTKNKSELLAWLFARDKKTEAYHITSDGQAFSEKHRADSHAATLDDKEVSSHSRLIFEQTEALKAAMQERKAANSNQGEGNEEPEPVSLPADPDSDQAEGKEEPEPAQEVKEAVEPEPAPIVEVSPLQEDKPVVKTKAKTTKQVK